MLKLSIITINYNNKQGLIKTIDSVINQNYKEFEYIIIDGGSTDGSKEYIISHNININYWVSEPDYGIYNAMNKGIKVANGEYLLFLNSGDYLYNNDILHYINKELKDDDIIYGNWVHYFNNGVIKEEIYPDKITFDFLVFKHSMPHQASFIRKKLLLEVGLYDETLKIASDWKFFLIAIFIYKCSVRYTNKFISYYNKDGFSTLDWAKTDSIQKKEVRKILDEEYPGLMGYLAEKNLRITYLENLKIVKILRKIKLIK